MKLTRFWVVRNPTRHSEMNDILFSLTADELPRVILGTGLATWVDEHTTLYTTKFEASVDAQMRMARLKTQMLRRDLGRRIIGGRS